MFAVVGDRAHPAEVDREVVGHRLVVEEVLLDHLAAVTEAQDEVAMAEMREDLHDVPEHGPAADIDEGLGLEFGFFPHAGALSAAENDDFHGLCPFVVRRGSSARNSVSQRFSTRSCEK